MTLRPQPSVQNEETPYGESPEATRPDSVSLRVTDTLALVTDTLAQLGSEGVRAIAGPACAPAPADQPRARVRHQRLSARLESDSPTPPVVRVNSIRGMATIYGPHAELGDLLRSEFSSSAGSTTLRGPRRPDGPPLPGCKPTHQLCDQSVRVPLPDPRIRLFTLVRVRASTNPPRLVR